MTRRRPACSGTMRGQLSGTVNCLVGVSDWGLEKGASALSSLVVGPLGLLTPFVHLSAFKAHPCEIQSIGQLGLQSPAPLNSRSD
jgi:hypothetical protein